jgi:hypothetical protein
MNEWRAESYEAGSVVVTTDSKDLPHFYVYGPIDDNQTRWFMAVDIAEFLNGDKERPDWLNDFRQNSPESIIAVDGSKILVIGPMYDADPPKLFWKECKDPESIMLRETLLSRLL